MMKDANVLRVFGGQPVTDFTRAIFRAVVNDDHFPVAQVERVEYGGHVPRRLLNVFFLVIRGQHRRDRVKWHGRFDS